MRPFHPLFRNSHLQTIAGAFWRRPFDAARYPVTCTPHRTEPDVQVLVHSQQPAATPRAALLLVHGLEGSSEAGYMRSAAHTALDAGFAVYRSNIRTCGGTEDLCQTLYHAGLSSDIRWLISAISPTVHGNLFLCGFSLGANQSLKAVAELGDSAAALLAGVVAVSTPIDLAACAHALRSRRANYLYQERFLRNMTARLERRCRTRADLFAPYLEAARTARDIWEFDDRVTARFFGFDGAGHYYATQSARLFLDRIRVPTLVIQAEDDPMIPFEVYDHPAFRTNPHLRLHATAAGGHVGFLARGPHRFWLDLAIRDWMVELGNKRAAAFV